jgi:hypothetical protein
MANITGQRVGGKFLLAGISYALDDEKKIMVHDGQDDEQKSPVTVFIISQEIGQDDIDRLVTHFQDRGVTIFGRGGFHQRATYLVTSPTQHQTISKVYQAWSQPVEKEPKPTHILPPRPEPVKQIQINPPRPISQPLPGSRARLIFGTAAGVLVLAFIAVIILKIIAPGSLFFSDDFESTKNTTNQWNPEVGKWQLIDGKYTCTTDQSRCLSLAKSVPSNYYTINVDVMGQEGVDKSIYFGLTNRRSFYVSLRAAPQNQLLITQTIENQPDKVLSQVDFQNSNRIQYSIKIRVQKQIIEVYVNNDLLLSANVQVQDLTGFVGIGVGRIKSGDVNKNSAMFDNFEVRIDQ